ncbi:hypothetical protein FRC08_001996 [Ceratobasidium sp. 394]|nr:hypothetical protein FRC08_001996 [Ceratobasidium sp. 394]
MSLVLPNQSSDEGFRRSLLQYSTVEVPSDSLIQSLYSEDTIGKILAKEGVTATTFHNLIRLLLVPSQLLSLQGTQILATLMSLLRQYCQDHRPYENEYGFYCIGAIMFVLGIAVLAESKFLKQYVDQTTALPGPRHTRSDYTMLGDCVAQFLPTAQRAETAWGLDIATRTLSPSLGGFTTSDLRFVVNLLWQNRKQMLWAHALAGTSPGWWYGIYLLWVFNEHTLRDHTLTNRIYAIALRVEVNSSWDKHDLLDKAIFTIRTTQRLRSDDMRTATRPIDDEDAKLALSKYYQYIMAYNRRDRQTLGLCIMWAGDLIFWLDNLDVYLEYLRSHLEVLWAGVLKEDSTLDRMVEGTVEQASLVFLAELALKFTKCVRSSRQSGLSSKAIS